jgi:hypothetical protein
VECESADQMRVLLLPIQRNLGGSEEIQQTDSIKLGPVLSDMIRSGIRAKRF